MTRKAILLFLVAVAIGAVAPAAFAQGCSMCRTALESSVEGRAIAGSFNYGILFLMGVPYAMFGAAGWAIYRAYRKHIAKDPDHSLE